MPSQTHTVEVDVMFTLSIELDDEFDGATDAAFAEVVARRQVTGVLDALQTIYRTIGNTTGGDVAVGETRVLEPWETQ